LAILRKPGLNRYGLPPLHKDASQGVQYARRKCTHGILMEKGKRDGGLSGDKEKEEGESRRNMVTRKILRSTLPGTRF